MRSTIKQKLEKAIEQDNTILVKRSEAYLSTGHKTEYMEYLGLSKADLKRLERAGMALRGYSQNVFLPGQKMPNGTLVEDKPGVTYRGKGHHALWIIVADSE